jgi:hypothetical protein
LTAQLLQADRQTDMKKLILAFSNFKNARKMALMPNNSVAVQRGSYKYRFTNFRPLNVCVGEGIIERKRA